MKNLAKPLENNYYLSSKTRFFQNNFKKSTLFGPSSPVPGPAFFSYPQRPSFSSLRPDPGFLVHCCPHLSSDSSAAVEQVLCHCSGLLDSVNSHCNLFQVHTDYFHCDLNFSSRLHHRQGELRGEYMQ